MTSQKKVEQVIYNGYSLEFGKVFEEAFENFKKIFGVAGVAMILYSIVLGGLMFGVMMMIMGAGSFSNSLVGFNVNALSGVNLVLFLLFSVGIGVLSFFVNAGFIEMAYRADANKDYSIGTAFEHFKSAFSKELLVAGTLISIISVGFSSLVQTYSNELLGNIATLVISFLTVLTIPLIIFSKVSGTKAIEYSLKLVLKQPIIIGVLLLLAFIVACLGIIALCIGIFFTIPILYSMYYVIYNNILPVEDDNEIDHIGKFIE